VSGQPVPLVMAAHGTRDPEGVAACLELADLVRLQLPGVAVTCSFVELREPGIKKAVGTALSRHESGSVVVVPLMLGPGGHVKRDIPDAISAAREDFPLATIGYASHLGPEPRLRAINLQRAQEASAAWAPSSTTMVYVGRGSSVAEANAEHVRLARLLQEEGDFAQVVPAFIQVSSPSLPEALDQVIACGGRSIVVVPNFLFPGRLRTWTQEQAQGWARTHPGATVRVAEVIGACNPLAEVVAGRYRDAVQRISGTQGAPVYLSGLDVRGRDVLIVGAGQVADRRVPGLLRAGARIRLVSPDATPALRALAASGQLRWIERTVRATDVDGAWFVMATTDDPDVNAMVSAAAEARHTFCVRADWAPGGSAWTPAVGHTAGLSIAVVGDRTPARSARARDAALAAIRALD